MSNDKQLDLSEKSINISSPKDLVDFASTLKKVIIQQKLYSEIQGRNYAHVEAWEFAGACMGVMPVIESVKQIAPTDDEMSEIKYRTDIKLVQVSTNQVVGYGVAFCSSKEKGRDKQDEYVIASMAQTRAVGKAYRNGFAWLLKMAGYEATPAEEMDQQDKNKSDEKKEAKDKLKQNLEASK